jgi:hypothetical protein
MLLLCLGRRGLVEWSNSFIEWDPASPYYVFLPYLAVVNPLVAAVNQAVNPLLNPVITVVNPVVNTTVNTLNGARAALNHHLVRPARATLGIVKPAVNWIGRPVVKAVSASVSTLGAAVWDVGSKLIPASLQRTLKQWNDNMCSRLQTAVLQNL